MSERRIEQIKRITSELTEKVKPLAKQAEAGFKANWMGVDKEGNAKWADLMPDVRPSKIVDKYISKEKDTVPGIVYSTAGIPAMLDLIHEGAAPKWAVEADEKAGKIKKAVEKKIGAPEPKGLIEHLARASGEMVAQLPTSGRTITQKAVLKGPGLVEKAITQGPELYETVTEQGPKIVKKILTAPIEYFGPIVDVTTPGRAAMSYGVGTAFGGGLGYALEKLTESDKKSEVQKLIDKYGSASGTEDHDISKPEGRQKFEKGGLGTKLKEGRSAFFSAIDNAIATLKQGKGTPEQLMSQVKKTPGVKKEELELRKLDKALAGKTSITKEELAEVAKKNPAPVPKIVRKKQKVTAKDQLDYALEMSPLAEKHTINQLFNYFEPSYGKDGIISKLNFSNEAAEVAGLTSDSPVNARNVRKLFNGMSDEGLITPEEIGPFTSAWKSLHKVVEDPSILKTKYSNMKLEGGTDYQEVLVQAPTLHDEFLKFKQENNLFGPNVNDHDVEQAWFDKTGLPVPPEFSGFTGGHWGEEVPNVMGHYRFQSFIDKDGKKVLHIEEIQSDPHQQARDLRKNKIEDATNQAIRDNVARLKAESPDKIPPGWKIEQIDKGDEMVDVKLIDDKGQVISTHTAFPNIPDNAGGSLAEVMMIMRNHSAVDKGFQKAAEQLVDKKEIESRFSDTAAYKSLQEERDLQDAQEQIDRIRNYGLEEEEIAMMYTPGNVVRGYGGYDKVLQFKPTTEDSGWQVQVIASDRLGNPRKDAQPRWHMTSPDREAIDELRARTEEIESKVFDMPWKKTYDELMLKQIIDDAVKGGYDRVSLSPGATQVDRYSGRLRQVVDNISWSPDPQGSNLMVVRGKKKGIEKFYATVENGKIVNSNTGDFVGERLSNVLGKDIVDQIEATPPGGTISGDNLTVGGEGMKSAYDKRMPDFLRDYIKKEYGTTLGVTEFGHGRHKVKTLNDIETAILMGDDDLDMIHQDKLMMHYNEYEQNAYERICKENGLDPDSEETLELFNLQKGPFKDYDPEDGNEYAVKQVAKQLYAAQLPEFENKLTAPAFDITPEMAEKVKTKGQRLFAASPVAILATAEDQDAKAEDLKNPAYRSEKGKAKIIADAMAAKQAELDKKNPEKRKEEPEQKPEEEKPGRDWLSQAPSRPKVGESKLKDIISFEGLAPYGLRNDGTSAKGKGYFGQLPILEGFATEISMEDDQGEFPLINPNLNRVQINQLLSDPSARPSDEIYELAQKYANQRRSAGKSTFIEPDELQYPLPDYATGGRVKMADGGYYPYKHSSFFAKQNPLPYYIDKSKYPSGHIKGVPINIIKEGDPIPTEGYWASTAKGKGGWEAVINTNVGQKIRLKGINDVEWDAAHPTVVDTSTASDRLIDTDLSATTDTGIDGRQLRMPTGLDYNRYARDTNQRSFFTDIEDAPYRHNVGRGVLKSVAPSYATGGRVKMFAGGSMGFIHVPIPRINNAQAQAAARAQAEAAAQAQAAARAQAEAAAQAQARAQAEAAAKEEAAREIVYVDNTNRNLRMPVNLDYNRYGRDYKQPSYFSDIQQHTDLRATPQARRPKFLQSIVDSNYGDYGFSKGGKAMQRIKNKMK